MHHAPIATIATYEKAMDAALAGPCRTYQFVKTDSPIVSATTRVNGKIVWVYFTTLGFRLKPALTKGDKHSGYLVIKIDDRPNAVVGGTGDSASVELGFNGLAAGKHAIVYSLSSLAEILEMEVRV